MSTKKIQDVPKLVEEYQANISARELAKKYNTSAGVIMSTLRRAGVKLRSLSQAAELRIAQHGYTPVNFTDEVRKKMRDNHADFSGEKSPAYKGVGKRSEDGAWLTPDANGYWRRKSSDHPLASGGYIGEHVFQACIKYGVEVVKGNDVHHVDGNNQNNHWDNLEVKTRADHMRLENNLWKNRK